MILSSFQFLEIPSWSISRKIWYISHTVRRVQLWWGTVSAAPNDMWCWTSNNGCANCCLLSVDCKTISSYFLLPGPLISAIILTLLSHLSQIFPTIDSLPASVLTPRTSRPDRFFWASPFYVCFSFFIIIFCLVLCGRLSWLLVSFWAHVTIVHRIISYRIVSYRISRCMWAVCVSQHTVSCASLVKSCDRCPLTRPRQ